MGRWYVEVAARLPSGDFTRNGNVLLALSSATLRQWRVRHRNTDVYAGIFRRLGPQLRSLPLGDVYFDLDANLKGTDWLVALDGAQAAAIRLVDVLVDELEIPEECIRVYFTGHKGYDLRVPHQCFGIRPHPELPQHYKVMALEVARRADALPFIDQGVYDGRRVIRLLNSIHSGASKLLGRPVHKVPLSVTELVSEDAATILALASKPRRAPWTTEHPEPVPVAVDLYRQAVKTVEVEKTTRKEVAHQRAAELPRSCSLPPCMAYLLEHGAPQGFRNNALFQLALFLHSRKGLGAQEIICQVNGFGGLDASEITTTVKSATRSTYRLGCRSSASRLWELVEAGVTVCDRDRCPVLEGF